MALEFSYIDWKSSVPLPPRLPNGGLYTGELAKGAWGNFPIEPDANVYASHLTTDISPPGIEKRETSFNRPGNNSINYPNHTYYDNNTYNIRCIN